MWADVEMYSDWAPPMARDCNKAKRSIICSAISIHPPRNASAHGIGQLWAEWCAAAARGVQVHLYMPVPHKAYPATIMNAKASDQAHARGIRVTFIKYPGLLHAKCCIVDAETLWIGSGNFTTAATAHNHEMYLRTVCAALAERTQKTLEAAAKK